MLVMQPENIRISTVNEKDALHANLTKIKFCGSFCRLSAKVFDINDDNEVIIDMLFSELSRLGLTTGKDFYINFPWNKLMRFAV